MSEPLPQRWNWSWGVGTVDAKFIYGLSRTYNTFGDTYSRDVPPDKDDASEWKAYAKTQQPLNPLLGFALAIDHWQEAAMRAMEANKWKLVATGNRAHDREVARDGKYVPAFTRLYIKKFPKSGVLSPEAAKGAYGVLNANSCAFITYDYGRLHDNRLTEAVAGPRVPNNTSIMSRIMSLHRVPLDKLPTFKYPKDNFFCIAKTKYARYYVANWVEIHIEEVK